MGTEWKRYSNAAWLKGIMLIVSWSSFTALVLCGTFLLMHPDSVAVLNPDPSVLQYHFDHDLWLSWGNNVRLAEQVIDGTITSAAALLCGIAYLVFSAGRAEYGGMLVLRNIDRLYADVHTGFVAIAALFFIGIIGQGTFDSDSYAFWAVLGICAFLSAIIGSSWVLSLVRLGKAGQLFSHTLCYRVFLSMADIWVLLSKGALVFFSNGRVWLALVCILAGYVAGNGLLILFLIQVYRNLSNTAGYFFLLLIAGANIGALVVVARWTVVLDHIMRDVKRIAAGDLIDTEMPAAMPSLLRPLAEDIRAIRSGQREAVAEAIRGERMKTDLITNVSHDLKTPLTAIVSYVDLLGKEDLQNERASGYVKILEEKSARMKQLVEDLVEASKASSGNLIVNAEPLELHQLVLQACGEFAGKFEAAGLDLKLREDSERVPVLADGRLVWRILENLLANACKYAQYGTRIYVQTGVEGGMGVLMMKNISAMPLEMPVSQLMERFVRGDAARSTEGSGLGLAIARSLAVLLHGEFEIVIDGDLFKATVKLPLTDLPVSKEMTVFI